MELGGVHGPPECGNRYVAGFRGRLQHSKAMLCVQYQNAIDSFEDEQVLVPRDDDIASGTHCAGKDVPVVLVPDDFVGVQLVDVFLPGDY